MIIESFQPSITKYTEIKTPVETSKVVDCALDVDHTLPSPLFEQLMDRVSNLEQAEKELEKATSASGYALIGLGCIAGLLLTAAGIVVIAGVIFGGILLVAPLPPAAAITIFILLELNFMMVAPLPLIGGIASLCATLGYIPSLKSDINELRLSLQQQLSEKLIETTDEAEIIQLQEAMTHLN